MQLVFNDIITEGTGTMEPERDLSVPDPKVGTLKTYAETATRDS